MRSRFGQRFRGADPDKGVYAVLYAALVVIMIGMAALVVDLATLRQSRNDDRSAADSAVIAGARLLNPQAVGGIQPQAACDAAWTYLTASIVGLKQPATACTAAPNNFPATTTASCPATQYGGPILAEYTSAALGAGRGKYYVTVSWPVAKTSPFLEPDLAPGDVTQIFSADIDGSDPGCDRIGVAIQHDQNFLLAPVLDVKRGNTLSSSVARIDPNGGPAEEVAALNVLNRRDCDILVVTGGGKAVVGPTLDKGVPVGGGIIAVESDGNGTCGGTDYTMELSGSGSSLCASLGALNPTATNCDGKGLIRSHALDPGGNNSFNDADVTSGTLAPRPVAEGGQYGWDPVTRLYGCEVIACTPIGTNFIAALKAALGGTGKPTANYLGAAPYVDPLNTTVTTPPTAAGFTDITTTVCPKVTTALPAFPPGNYYANCTLDIRDDAAQLIFEGGTIVANGGLKLTKGCFAVNAKGCSTAFLNVGTAEVTTDPPPGRDAILYLRGNDFVDDATLIMPQTFVYQAAAAKSLDIKTTSPTLWTAPGAGATTAGRTALEAACFVATPSPGAVDQNCLNSRFSRLAYWSEFPAPKTAADNFGGQGQLALVGVFFAPRAYLNLTGGSGYSAASAQFWADKLNINGTGTLVLSPDTRFSIKTPTSRVALIR